MTSRSSSQYAFGVLDEQAPSLGELRVLESDIETPAGKVLHGKDSEGKLHLLIPLSADQQAVRDQGSAGVHLVPKLLASEHKEQHYQVVVCLLPHLNSLFIAVADEMLDAINEHPGEAPQRCQMVLDRWRELFERPRTGLLGPEKLKGLIAELVFLERLARRGPQTALASWTGPEGHRFDFVSGGTAAEVKASASRDGRVVEIHGHRQLDPPDDGELFLVFIKLEKTPSGSLTAPRIIERLRAAGVPALPLHSKLDKVGFSVQDRQEYENFSYDLLEELMFAVDDSLPRITPGSFTGGDIPSGVSHLRYRIDLSGPSPPPLTETQAREMVEKFGHSESPR